MGVPLTSFTIAFQQMRIDKEWLLLSDTQLIGFSHTKVFLIESITWQVTIGIYP